MTRWRMVKHGIVIFVLQQFGSTTMMHSRAHAAPFQTGDTALRWHTQKGESVAYEVACRPARAEDGVVRNWTLKQLDDAPFKERLAGAFDGHQPARIFAPTVDRMSGIVLPQARFTSFFPLNRLQEVRRPGFELGSDARVPCDSTDLQPHDAFAMSAGGCPLIVLSGTSYREGIKPVCLAAHAGRDSLIDHKFLQYGLKSRDHFSIVDAMVAFGRKRFVDPEDMTLRSFFAIPWQRFPHDARQKEHRRRNARAQWHFREESDVFRIEPSTKKHCLDLSRVIWWQARRAGVGSIETGVHTLPIDGDYAYTTHTNPELSGAMRNLVTVVRH